MIDGVYFCCLRGGLTEIQQKQPSFRLLKLSDTHRVLWQRPPTRRVPLLFICSSCFFYFPNSSSWLVNTVTKVWLSSPEDLFSGKNYSFNHPCPFGYDETLQQSDTDARTYHSDRYSTTYAPLCRTMQTTYFCCFFFCFARYKQNGSAVRLCMIQWYNST